MTTEEAKKVRALLRRHYTKSMAKHLIEMIEDDEQTASDMELMDKRAQLISSTDNGKRPVPDKFCPHCGSPLYAETDLSVDYPYVCWECDENFYSFEAETAKE